MFVVYNKETTVMHTEYRKGRSAGTDRWASAGAAKAAITRAVKKGKIEDANEWAVAEINEFRNNIELQVERVNMMSGKTYLEPINTPAYMSPSRESYWAM